MTPLLSRATELLVAGRPADAIAPLREAARLQPANAIIQHDLGLACLENWYEATGFIRAFPGEDRVKFPNELKVGAAPRVADLDD